MQEILSLVQQSLGLESTEDQLPDEEAMVQWLAVRIEAMLEREPGLLFSTLYRLDVSESVVQHALSPVHPEPGHVALARAVWDRQKQRYETKKAYQTPPLEDDDLAY